MESKSKGMASCRPGGPWVSPHSLGQHNAYLLCGSSRHRQERNGLHKAAEDRHPSPDECKQLKQDSHGCGESHKGQSQQHYRDRNREELHHNSVCQSRGHRRYGQRSSDCRGAGAGVCHRRSHNRDRLLGDNSERQELSVHSCGHKFRRRQGVGCNEGGHGRLGDWGCCAGLLHTIHCGKHLHWRRSDCQQVFRRGRGDGQRIHRYGVRGR